MATAKQKKPNNKHSEGRRTGKMNTAGENRGHTRPKQDNKGEGRRVALSEHRKK